MYKYILQINAVIIEGYVTFYMLRLFCTDFVKIHAEYLKILQNIHRYAVTFNTNVYPLFFYLKIFYKYLLQRLKKYLLKLFTSLSSKIFKYILTVKNSPALFSDILYCTTIFCEDL